MDRNPRIACCLMGCLLCIGPTTTATGDPPDTVTLTGIVRDFNPRGTAAGHWDFGRSSPHGRSAGHVATTLGVGSKPDLIGGGAKITKQWRDAAHREICHCVYDDDAGDVKGKFGAASTGDIESDQSFEQWYRDVPGINMSAPLAFTLHLGSDGVYVFDDRLDPVYQARGGFYPVDDKLLGNPDADHNNYFTVELHATFIHDAGATGFFIFAAGNGHDAKDDVWVFIDGRMVVELSGVHASHDQHVDIGRLGLQDGEPYRLDLFYASRYDARPSFRMSTNLPLTDLPVTTVSMAFD